MSVERKLSQVLGEFARTMATDFPIQSILDHLVDQIVGVLPIDAAGVTLIEPGIVPRYVAASNDDALRFEQLQSELNEGPCVVAYATNDAVVVADLRDDGRFPTFSKRAEDAGLMAVFTFPLRHGDERLGALDLYRMSPGELSEEALAAAQTLADVATAYLLNARAREDLTASSDRANHASLHDALTGLPNRSLLIERLDHAIHRCVRSETSVVILYVDLDRFKVVNDTYGHQMGDELLRAVAVRLTEVVRPADTVARLAGDEFVILCEDVIDATGAELLADRLRHALAVPFRLCGSELHVSASVGIAFAGPGCDVPEQVLQDADTAMYLAKRRGGAVNSSMDVREHSVASRQTNLNHDLRFALARDEIYCDYQPIVATDTGDVIGAEALVRWAHSSQGIVGPDTLVPLAEHSGLINSIGRSVLVRACEDRERWVAVGAVEHFQVNVNVSARQLVTPGFVAGVADVLAETSTPPAEVTLEITESVFVHDVEHVRGVMSDLKQLGVMIALDDFGTGYSSLAYLKRFPVDTLKIDRMFIEDIDSSDEANAVVGSIIALAHRLQLNVVAEGIETVAQYRAIAELCCDQCQGYFFARPMSGNAFFELMATSSIGRAGTARTNGTHQNHAWQPATVRRPESPAMTPRP